MSTPSKEDKTKKTYRSTKTAQELKNGHQDAKNGLKYLQQWLAERKIEEVECLVPDMSGIARGKILPATKFLKSVEQNSLRLPESLFIQTVTGEYADIEDSLMGPQDHDINLHPAAETIRVVPWYGAPTAQVICDCYYNNGRPIEFAPRHILKCILDLYHAKGWQPIVAPELEFFLVQVNTDPDLPLSPPIGRSGRPETGRQSYGIDAVNEFDPIFEEVYDFCEAQDIDIDTLTHEAGAAQMEINFNHGDAMRLADMTFLFKRTVRQTALRHNVYATFMAKPLANEPGSAMHIHQSVVDLKNGQNLFANAANGKDSLLFRSHVAGLQRYLPFTMPLLGPNVNSYRRLQPYYDAPINVHWGIDNRTVGLRVPIAPPEGRRIENRLAGADANPYLAMAASLACGYLGMVEKLTPTEQIDGSAYRLKHTLPRTLNDALQRFESNKSVRSVLGDKFVEVFAAVKRAELDAYQKVISSWEREHLLLNV
ncbi:MAG: glutamine synthetase [Alphaproteobacteria bacterium]|nr:glutamine synthetase [Alphaproteobacteria bacterium]